MEYTSNFRPFFIPIECIANYYWILMDLSLSSTDFETAMHASGIKGLKFDCIKELALRYKVSDDFICLVPRFVYNRSEQLRQAR